MFGRFLVIKKNLQFTLHFSLSPFSQSVLTCVASNRPWSPHFCRHHRLDSYGPHDLDPHSRPGGRILAPVQLAPFWTPMVRRVAALLLPSPFGPLWLAALLDVISCFLQLFMFFMCFHVACVVLLSVLLSLVRLCGLCSVLHLLCGGAVFSSSSGVVVLIPLSLVGCAAFLPLSLAWCCIPPLSLERSLMCIASFR